MSDARSEKFQLLLFIFIQRFYKLSQYTFDEPRLVGNLMEHNLRAKRQTYLKQNSALRANQYKAKAKLSSAKLCSKVQPQTLSPQITPPPQKPQAKKQTLSKPSKKQLVTRKHIYNSKQITQVHDLKTGRSEYKAKAPIQCFLGQYNELITLGNNLLNVGPLSGNEYYTTEWIVVQNACKQHENLKTDTTMQNSQRQVQGKKKFQQFCRGRMLDDNLTCKSEDLHRRSRKKRAQRRSKSSEGVKSLEPCSQRPIFRCSQVKRGDKDQ